MSKGAGIAGLLAVAVGQSAFGQAFNIDFGLDTDTPPAEYGAAAGQPGIWQSIRGSTIARIPLRDTSGAETSATLRMGAPFGAGAPAQDTGVLLEDGQLLNDFLDLRFSHSATFYFEGLRPGRYGAYAYAWAPDAQFVRLFVSVSGAPRQETGGFWPGFQQLGVTYAEFHVTVPRSLTFVIGNEADSGAFNGIQLVPELLFADLALTQPMPAVVPEGRAFTFDVSLFAGDEELTSPPTLHHRAQEGGPYLTSALVPLGGGLYRATLPPPACGDRPEFYLSYAGSESGAHTLPEAGVAAPFRVEVGAESQRVLLHERFDTGLPTGWAASGLWHVTGDCEVPPGDGCGAGLFASYANDDDCTYETGEQTTGLLVSAPVALGGLNPGAKVELSLCYAKETDGIGGPYDAARVLVNWLPVGLLPDTDGWSTITFDATQAATGPEATVIVSFNSHDASRNAFRGVQVDSITLRERTLTCGGCRADFDGTNGVQVADIFAFLRAWFANSPSADFDQQNGIQVADIFAFLRAWFAGC